MSGYSKGATIYLDPMLQSLKGKSKNQITPRGFNQIIGKQPFEAVLLASDRINRIGNSSPCSLSTNGHDSQ